MGSHFSPIGLRMLRGSTKIRLRIGSSPRGHALFLSTVYRVKSKLSLAEDIRAYPYCYALGLFLPTYP